MKIKITKLVPLFSSSILFSIEGFSAKMSSTVENWSSFLKPQCLKVFLKLESLTVFNVFSKFFCFVFGHKSVSLWGVHFVTDL